MADNDLDVIFQLGAEEDSSFRSHMESLAKAVESTQDRIDKSVASTGKSVLSTVDRIRRTNESVVSKVEVTPEVDRASLSRTGDDMKKWAAENPIIVSASAESASRVKEMLDDQLRGREIEVGIKADTEKFQEAIKVDKPEPMEIPVEVDAAKAVADAESLRRGIDGVSESAKQASEAVKSIKGVNAPIQSNASELRQQLDGVRSMIEAVNQESQSSKFAQWADKAGVSVTGVQKTVRELKDILNDPMILTVGADTKPLEEGLMKLQSLMDGGGVDVKAGVVVSEDTRDKVQKQIDYLFGKFEPEVKPKVMEEKFSQEILLLRQKMEELRFEIDLPPFDKYVSLAGRSIDDFRAKVEDLQSLLASSEAIEAEPKTGDITRKFIELQSDLEAIEEARTQRQSAIRAEATQKEIEEMKGFYAEVDKQEAGRIAFMEEAEERRAQAARDAEKVHQSVDKASAERVANMKAKEAELQAERDAAAQEKINQIKAEDKAALDAIKKQIKGESDLRKARGASRRNILSLEKDYVALVREAEAYNGMVRQGTAEIRQFGTLGATALTKIGRGAALLGYAFSDNDEQMKKAMQTFAKVQGAADGIVGTFQGFRAVAGIIDGATKAMKGKLLATQADNAATIAQQRLADARRGIIAAEVVAVRGLTAETLNLANARRAAGSADIGGGAAGVARGAAGKAAGGAAVGATGAAVGGGAVGGKAFAGTATAGSIAAAGAAAAAGLALAGKSAYEFVGDIKKAGVSRDALGLVDRYGVIEKALESLGVKISDGGAEVGGWSDTIASTGVSFADSLMEIIPGVEGFIGEERTLRLASIRKENEQRAMLNARLESIELATASRIESIRTSSANQIAAIDAAARSFDSPEDQAQARLTLAQQQSAKTESSIKEAMSQIGRFRTVSGELARPRNEPRNEAEIRAFDELTQKLSRLGQEQANNAKAEIAAQRQIAEMKRAASMEEIRSIQEAIKLRNREIEQLENSTASISKQFAELSRGEARAFQRSLDKARGGEELNPRDAKALALVQTEETRKYLESYFDRRAKERGIEGFGFSEFDDLQDARKDRDAKREDLTNRLTKEGVQVTTQVELIDSRQITVKLDEQIASVVKEVAAQSKRQIEDLRRQVEELMRANAENQKHEAREENRKRKGSQQSTSW